MSSKTKQVKKGRWVARRPERSILGEPWMSQVEYWVGHTVEIVLALVPATTRAECRRRAAAIRDLPTRRAGR